MFLLLIKKIFGLFALIQIKAALRALRNVGNLPVLRMPEDTDKSISDILEWLSTIFGFQVFDFIGCSCCNPESLSQYVSESKQSSH